MTPKDDKNSSPPSIIIGTLLLIAVSLCSSAGTVFDQLTTVLDVPPFLAAFWRLFLQNIIQFIPFVIQLRQAWREDERKKMMRYWRNGNGEDSGGGGGLVLKLDFDDATQDEDDDDDTKGGTKINQESDVSEEETLIIPKYIKSLPLLALSGFALGVHFSMWVYSLRYTSLTHSLLWVGMSPIVLNLSSWTAYFTTKVCTLSCFSNIAVRKPSFLETVGALLGVCGAVCMLVDITNQKDQTQNTGQPHSHPPSIHGDIAAFIGAVAVALYLVIGKHVRSWLPIWLYVFPVIGVASITCLSFAFIDDDNNKHAMWKGMTHISVFAVFSKEYFFYALYLAIGPGIFGHTMINTLLRYISPLIVSTALLSEPVTGSVIGHIFGMQTLPAIYTWIGGFVLLVGLVLVIVGESKVNDNAEKKQDLISKRKNGKYGSLQTSE